MKLIKKILKNLTYFFYDLLSVFYKKNNQAVVLMYHSVAANDSFSAVRANMFLRQIKYLVKHNYKIVSLCALAQYLKSGDLPAKIVVITFDDGFQDNYLNVFPVLKKYNLPAAIFLSSSFINNFTHSRDGLKIAMLTEKAIREMIESGLITIGSHCHNHKKLANLNDNEIDYELAEAKKIVKEKFNYDMDFLAYPFGSFNEKVKLVARNYYQLAFSVKKGKICMTSDWFELNRNSIDSKISFYQFKHIIKYGRV